jgi:hypothetical protein
MQLKAVRACAYAVRQELLHTKSQALIFSPTCKLIYFCSTKRSSKQCKPAQTLPDRSYCTQRAKRQLLKPHEQQQKQQQQMLLLCAQHGMQ